MIAEMARLYGTPCEKRFIFRIDERELNRIRSSQKRGRNHDVTLYINKGDKVIVNAKHIHPPGLYRAPSGGLNPGESFQAGINREMTEELGCQIEVERFLLKTSVSFSTSDETVWWRSFVFLARYIRGDFDFTDHREIREVRLAEWSEFQTFNKIMRQTDIGGLHYRAALHEAVVELLGTSR